VSHSLKSGSPKKRAYLYKKLSPEKEKKSKLGKYKQYSFQEHRVSCWVGHSLKSGSPKKRAYLYKKLSPEKEKNQSWVNKNRIAFKNTG